MANKARTHVIDYTVSSGNIYADLDYPDPETMLEKSKVARELDDLMRKRNLCPECLAELMDMDDPDKCYDITRGRLRAIALEDLQRWKWNLLDRWEG